jgi:hypothetical protein
LTCRYRCGPLVGQPDRQRILVQHPHDNTSTFWHVNTCNLRFLFLCTLTRPRGSALQPLASYIFAYGMAFRLEGCCIASRNMYSKSPRLLVARSSRFYFVSSTRKGPQKITGVKACFFQKIISFKTSRVPSEHENCCCRALLDRRWRTPTIQTSTLELPRCR